MVSFPPCKINLGLYIINKRADGYHNLVTCFYPVPWTDVLEIIPANELNFTCSGTSIPGNERDNICLKAYSLLKHDFNLPPVKIHLHKIIPTGAGLGGGSSNAAYTLRMLNDIFELQCSTEKLFQYASALGSDCAFFIQDKPMLATARGEVLSEITLSLAGKFIVIVKPPVHVSTAEAYAGVIPRHVDINLGDSLQKHTVNLWKGLVVNNFEDTVFKHHPSIAGIKNTLYKQGALYASMSGSGSSVFGIFENEISTFNEFKEFTYWCGVL